MTIRMTSIPISDENYIDDLRQLTNIVKIDVMRSSFQNRMI